MSYNNILSNEVTKLFKNTKVNVYIYQSKKANIIGIPGANKNITPEMLRNEAARDAEIAQMNAALFAASNNGGIFMPITPNSGTLYESVANSVNNVNKDGSETKLIFDPINKKLDINVEEVTVYISSNYINCMEHDDEIIAAILCEISKNTILFKKYIQDKTLNISLTLLTIVSVCLSTINLFKSINNLNSNVETYEAINIISPFILSIIGPMMLYIVISIYLNKRRNIEYDEFVIKCGYGDALNRAIDNYNKFIFGNSTTQSDAMSALGWYDKIAHFIYKIGMYIYNFCSKLGITSNQSILQRHNTIENKTNNYDYNLIDRSDRIL